MALVKFSNRNGNQGTDRWVDELLSPFFNDTIVSAGFNGHTPAVNIAETADAYQIELVAPGFDKGDFKINVEKDLLTVSVEKETEVKDDSKTYSKREYSFSSFSRSFNLPDSIDHNGIDASYKDGVLQVTVAKKEEAKVAARLIEVK